MATIDKFSLMERLPKVGQKRMERMAVGPEKKGAPPPEPCVVVEVNRAHLWYRVRFIRTGFHECYKLPRTGPLSWEVQK